MPKEFLNRLPYTKTEVFFVCFFFKSQVKIYTYTQLHRMWEHQGNTLGPTARQHEHHPTLP